MGSLQNGGDVGVYFEWACTEFFIQPDFLVGLGLGLVLDVAFQFIPV